MKHSRDSRVEGSSQRSDVRISERQAATFAEAPAAKERSPYKSESPSVLSVVPNASLGRMMIIRVIRVIRG